MADGEDTNVDASVPQDPTRALADQAAEASLAIAGTSEQIRQQAASLQQEVDQVATLAAKGRSLVAEIESLQSAALEVIEVLRRSPVRVYEGRQKSDTPFETAAESVARVLDSTKDLTKDVLDRVLRR